MPIFFDNSGIVWIGTNGGGVTIYNPNKRKFYPSFTSINESQKNNQHFVKSILEDSKGNLWIGTDGGLNRFDSRKNLLSHFTHNLEKPGALRQGGISALHEDKKHNLWIGTWGSGIYRFNFDKNNFAHIDQQSDCCIHTITSGENKLWLGSVTGNLQSFDYTANDSRWLIQKRSFVTKVLIDTKDKNLLWVATLGSGLRKVNSATGKITDYTFDKTGKGLSNNEVLSLHQNAAGLWIGTKDGLNFLNINTGKFKYYNVKDGFADNSIQGILEDNAGFLWMGTEKGLTKFNPKTGAVFNYNENDGLIVGTDAYYRAKSGEMFFGGKDGINNFFPDKIKNNTEVPPVLLTNFQIFNKSIAS